MIILNSFPLVLAVSTTQILSGGKTSPMTCLVLSPMRNQGLWTPLTVSHTLNGVQKRSLWVKKWEKEKIVTQRRFSGGSRSFTKSCSSTTMIGYSTRGWWKPPRLRYCQLWRLSAKIISLIPERTKWPNFYLCLWTWTQLMVSRATLRWLR